MVARDELFELLITEITELKKTVTILQEENKQLKEKVARLEKNSGNSSKPPSSDIVKPDRQPNTKKRKKRKRGAQKGHRKFTRPDFRPEEIDAEIHYELTEKDALGLIPLDEWEVLQQITLPEKLYYVTEHRARKYIDPLTGQIHIAPIPDAIKQGGLLGADMSALIAFMKGGCHMSYTTIQQFFKEVLKLDICRGQFTKVTQKVSQSVASAYNTLVDLLPTENNLGVDETGHKNNGEKHWIWCFQTQAFSLFHIDKSRGSQVLFDLLGEDFAGILNCDYYSSYHKFTRLSNAVAQYCMAHLIRDILFLTKQSSKKLIRWAETLLDWLKQLFNTLHRHDSLTPKGYARRMRMIQSGFIACIRKPPDHRLSQALAKRFKGDKAENYFRFLSAQDVEPTNNGTEREIRHTVIDRRITQGTRSDKGMRWCERIWTVIATCKKQQKNVFEFLHDSVLAHWNNEDAIQLL